MEDRGPERLTFVERLVCSLRLPYPAGALLLSSLLSSPVYFSTRYIDSGDLRFALTPIFDNQLVSPEKFGLAIANFAMYTLIIFYSLYATRYMRMKVVQTEPDLRPLFSEGESTLHAFFGRVSNVLPSAALAAAFYVPSFPFALSALQTGGTTYGVYLIISSPIIYFIFGSFTWMFVSALWGLYRLGKEPIRLKTFLEDRMLGAGSFGSLSLSLAFSYIVFIGIGVLLFLTDPSGQFPLSVFLVFQAGLLVGIALFFLPLVSVHGKMTSERKREWGRLRKEMVSLLSSEEQRLDGAKDSTNYLASLTRAEMRERALATTATWPFDTKVLGKLVALVLSVAAILLSTVLRDILGI